MDNRIRYIMKIGRVYSYEVNARGRIIKPQSYEYLQKHPSVCKGCWMEFDEKKYWLFRDEEENLWFMGEDIPPLKVTDEVVSTLEGENWKQRTITIYHNNKVHFRVIYLPVQHDDFPTPYFDDQDDYGLYIHNILSDSEKRRYVWTNAWYDGSYKTK